MQPFPYSLDPVTLEIFPSHISSNSLILFHGTSSFYSNEIESNGLQTGNSPYNIQQAKSLVETLKSHHFSAFDTRVSYGLFSTTAAESIEDYIRIIESGTSTISLAALSSASVPYTLGNRIGGQAWGGIRNAQGIIDKALETNGSLLQHIPEEAMSILKAANQFNSHAGVVYAIRVPSDLHGLKRSNLLYTIYSENDIPVSDIIGKVVIPSSVDMSLLSAANINLKYEQKITKASSIWAKLIRKEEAEKDLAGEEDNEMW